MPSASGKEKKRQLTMSLEQTLEDERQELLRNLDGLKSPRVARTRKNSNPLNNINKTGRRASLSLSSPLASSSPWTNTLLSEWDDAIYEPSDDEPEQERRASDSVTQLRREQERKRKALQKRNGGGDMDVDIDAGFLHSMHGMFHVSRFMWLLTC